VPAGLDNMGGSDAGRLSLANTLGTTGGSETVTLTSAQSGVPAHSHANTLTNNAVTSGAGSAHSHASTASFSGSFSGTAGTTGNDSPDHSHTSGISLYTVVTGTGTLIATVGGGFTSGASNGANTRHTHTFTPAGSVSGTVTMTNPTESAHTHSVTSNVAISNVNNTAANAASAHDNMQPTILLNYIIKT
jgi:microcystin-dependent protein